MSDHPYTCSACNQQVDGRGHDRVCAARIVIVPAPVKKPPKVNPQAAISRVRELLEMRYLSARSLRSNRIRKDVIAFVRNEGIDYVLFKNGRWACSTCVHFFDIDEPRRGNVRGFNSRGSSRGCVRSALRGLVVLGLLAQEDAAVVRTYINDQLNKQSDERDRRALHHQAKRFGFKLVHIGDEE